MTRQPITDREGQVLALLADRLSNAQIAHRLSISVRTVEHHVSALLRKCGAGNRRELAEFASRTRAGLPRRLAGLPSVHTSFVGRDAELAMVRECLESARLVTLLGPGGVGKTRLAAAVAEAVAPALDNRGGFVDLVPVRGDFVAAAVAAAVGVVQRPQQPLADTVAEHLGDRPALLVLDSCEHVLDAVADLVARIIAVCPAVLVLTTSRERLGLPGERTVPVDPLGAHDGAVTLFGDRATAVDPRFSADPDTVAQICTRLDGMPLAIELAAARIPALGAKGLLTALADTMRVLAGGRNPDPRHRSLRAVIDWSHQLLEEPEQVLFRRLAVFAGPFDLSAATAVAACEDAATDAVSSTSARGGDRTALVVDLLGRLVDKSLLVHLPRTGRWRMLDTIRSYAQDQLVASDEQEAVRQRHLRWAAAAAAALQDRLDGDWADRFDTVVDDLRAALDHLRPEPDPVAHQLARSLGHLTYTRQLRPEAVDRFRQAARHALTPTDAAIDLRSAAESAAAVYRADTAFDLLLQAASKAREADDEDMAAALLAHAADVGHRFKARFAVEVPDQRLRELHHEAATVSSPTPLTAAAIAITAAWAGGSHTPDPLLAEQALTAARAIGDPVLIWNAIDTVTSVYERRGHLRRAYELARTGLALLADLDRNDPRSGATVNSIHHMTAIYATAAGDLPAAIAIGRAAANDRIAAEPISLASMLVPPLVLIGDFDEALWYANTMWKAWQAAGRSTAGWLWFPAATAALAHGLTGDRSGFWLWRDRMSDFAGPRNVYRLRTSALAHFADARMAVHTGDFTEAVTIVEAAFSDPAPTPRYRVFAQAAAAELAVVAGLPNPSRYLDAAANLATENDWATACLLRARGRYYHDADMLRESAATWERIGAHFEHEDTLRLLARSRHTSGETRSHRIRHG